MKSSNTQKLMAERKLSRARKHRDEAVAHDETTGDDADIASRQIDRMYQMKLASKERKLLNQITSPWASSHEMAPRRQQSIAATTRDAPMDPLQRRVQRAA